MNIWTKLLMIGAVTGTVTAAGCAVEHEIEEVPGVVPEEMPGEVTENVDVEAAVPDDYPVDICIVSGMKLGSMGEPYEYEHEGRRILFCCAGCVGEFEDDPEKYLKKLDDAKQAAQLADAQLADYPLDVCVVSGEALDEWGDSIDHIYDGRLVRFCCNHCKGDFLENPEPFLTKLDEGTPPEPLGEPHHHHDHEGHEHHHHDH